MEAEDRNTKSPTKKSSPRKPRSGKGKGKAKKPQPTQLRAAKGKGKVSKTEKAKLNFSVGRALRALKKGRYAPRVSPLAGVAMASILEYIISELVELSGNEVKRDKKTTIKPKHIASAVAHDLALKKTFANVYFPAATRMIAEMDFDASGEGVVPEQFKAGYKKKSKKSGKKAKMAKSTIDESLERAMA
jgi:histone H2A